ncbi:MAG: sigma-70 family RNA polymerase sigma factor, partial [Chthoniobacteraceae bacterium]
ARTWLFTTLYRHFLRQRQRSARFVATELDDVEPSALATPSLAEAHVDGRLVLECLQRLDETFRAPLTLFYLDQLSYREIAEALEVPIGTVMSRLARGKDQLRALLGKEESASRGKITPFTNPQLKRTARP